MLQELEVSRMSRFQLNHSNFFLLRLQAKEPRQLRAGLDFDNCMHNNNSYKLIALLLLKIW